MIVDWEICIGCGLCVETCPLEAIQLVKKGKENKASISEACVDCNACTKVCPKEAILSKSLSEEKRVKCFSCPIQCLILEGYTGACQRFVNRNGELVRNTPLHRYEEVAEVVGKDYEEAIRKPLITGIGAGTTYPDTKPAPYIVQSKVEGVDVVTVVTEAPLSYSGIKVKIDTEIPIGEEGAPILIGTKRVGHICAEEYGSKILSLGGVNLITGREGLAVAKLIADIANRKEVKLTVRGGAELVLQVGKPPVINGRVGTKMRVGCGSASMGLFGRYFLEAADEVIVLDSHLIGLFTEHPAGRELGARYSGIKLKARKSTPGRYFGEHGGGWGGTTIEDPLDILEGFDSEITKPGTTLLITETTGERAAMFCLGNHGKFEQIELTPKAKKAVEMIALSCEVSRVSAVFIGGAGGSARAGVTKIPLKLNQAIHQNRARLTVGGAPTYILPGGGITFLVDVEKVIVRAFTYVPTPALVVPLEYTMRLEEYIEMGGHQEKIRKLEDVLKEIEKRDAPS